MIGTSAWPLLERSICCTTDGLSVDIGARGPFFNEMWRGLAFATQANSTMATRPMFNATMLAGYVKSGGMRGVVNI